MVEAAIARLGTPRENQRYRYQGSATGAAIGGYQDEVGPRLVFVFSPPLVGRRALGVAGFSLSVSLYLCMCEFAFICGLHELCFV